MAFTRTAPLPATKKYRVLAQDPSVRDSSGSIITAFVEIPYEELDSGPRGARVHVVDFDAARGIFYAPEEITAATLNRWFAIDGKVAIDRFVNDFTFQAYNVYAIVMRTLARFEFALGRRLSWSFDGHQLHVAPHAFAAANAFYSKRDRGLFCGYFKRNGKTIYTCLSHDVLAHETTHALLDGLRQRYTEPSSPEQAAFHEGFADVVALLSIFSLPGVVEKCIDLHASNVDARQSTVSRKWLERSFLEESVLLGLGDEMGATLDRKALRRSVKITPKEGRAILSKKEPHDLGEVLVAAMMNSFLDVWTARLATLGEMPGTGGVDRGRAAEEGRISADHLLTMVIRAIDYSPPVDVRFFDFLSAVLTSDLEIQPTDRFNYREHLLSNFVKYGIRPTSKGFGSHKGVWEPPEQPFDYSNTVLENMQRDSDEVFRFIWQNREALGIWRDAYTRVQSVRPCTRMSSEGFVLRETVAEYVQILDIQARDLESLPWSSGEKDAEAVKPASMPPRTRIRLYGGGALIFSDRGELKYHVRNRILNADRQRERLANLWKAGEFRDQPESDRRFAEMHRMRALGGATSPFASEDFYDERF